MAAWAKPVLVSRSCGFAEDALLSLTEGNRRGAVLRRDHRVPAGTRFITVGRNDGSGRSL